MRLPLILFILSMIFFMIGYTNTIHKQEISDIEVRIIPRNVYDQIIYDSLLFPNSDK